MAIKRRAGSSKNPPIFSHEFVIQNHADIVSCIAMIFVLGLLFQVGSNLRYLNASADYDFLILQATAPLTSMFVVMSHNVSFPALGDELGSVLYTTGAKDVALVFFYTLICIVMHAVIQEYMLDKLNRRLHLSKVKHSKFNESGQLVVFYILSVVWGTEIIRREGLWLSLSSLWSGYPHLEMTYMLKFFFIIQLSYWLHSFPELYFQKIKKDEMSSRITYATLYLFMWSLAYTLNLTRVALCLGVIHYFVESLFHASRLFYFADSSRLANIGFRIWNVLFVLARLGSITLSVLTFWFGLSLTSRSDLSWAEGNFNTPLIRINLLVAVGLTQAWMMWNFINFHLKRLREKAAEVNASKKKHAKKLADKKKKEEQEVNELPEVDQNTKITQRSSAKSKK